MNIYHLSLNAVTPPDLNDKCSMINEKCMKTCPQCQTTYTDDSLQFCLQDGTRLVTSETFSTSRQNWSDSPTLIAPPTQGEKIQIDLQKPAAPAASELSQPTVVVEKPKKTNTGLIVALSILLTLLIAGAGAGGAYLYLRGGKQDVGQTANTKLPANAGAPNTANNKTPAANANSNVNANVSPSPSVSPSPKATLRAEQISEIEDRVSEVIEDWREALDEIDLDKHLKNYAETVDFYNAGRVPLSRVRAEKQPAFDTYDSIDVGISNPKIKVDESGERATVVFDKEWVFTGEERYSSGKVQQQLQFARVSGKWRITGEKDLKVYYTNR